MKISETITENFFRNFYGSGLFIEKSAIPPKYGFKSKKSTGYIGYPDFFLELEDYCIVVEAKAQNHQQAENEVQFYMLNNKLDCDVIGIAISGQTEESLSVSYFLLKSCDNEMVRFPQYDVLLSLDTLHKNYIRIKYGEMISSHELVNILKDLNRRFNNGNRIRDTERSLFFSGLMIALNNNNFRSTYRNIQPEQHDDSLPESHNLNKAILEAVTSELDGKINNLSKEFSWRDKFSFIKNIDYPLDEYKEIIEIIESKIFHPFHNEEKQDILGRAYKIFLSRAGKVDNRNIILTPDHIKTLMIKLARLSADDVVLDTCTGSGGFLMGAMETMIKLAHGDKKKIAEIKEKQLIGFEIDSVLFALACSNMFLHGDGRTNLIFRSSLLNDSESDRKLFCYIRNLHPTRIIINPPYENNNPAKFTLQALKYLDSNGKLIVIMPTPTLTHNLGGLTEKILSLAKLEYVIKMPFKLFSEQKRTVNTSIFGFSRTPHNYNDEVMFYNLDDDGFISIQHRGRVDKNGTWPDTQRRIIEAIFNMKEIKGVCSKRKIYQDGILNPAGVPSGRKDNCKMIKIKDLFNIQRGTLASESNIEGDYAFITAGEEWKTHNEYASDGEAIVYAVSAAGSLGRSHYVNGKFTASNLCLFLTDSENPNYTISMQFYNYYFTSVRKQIVSDIADGTSKLTISPEVFADYYIEYIPYEQQKNFVGTEVREFLKLKQRYILAQEHLLQAIYELS